MRSRIRRTMKMVMFTVMFVVMLALLGFVIKGLWNWLLPDLFGWKTIGYWQAVGLLVLCKILFGGFGGSHGRRHRHGGLRERLENMTPEEREKLRETLRGCWERGVPPDSKPSA